VRCDVAEGRYQSNLVLSVDSGKLKPGSFEWSAKVAPSGHTCVLRGLEQQPFKGGLRFASGRCSVTLREVGEFVRVAAENCAAQCGSQAYLEPLIVDRRGRCETAAPGAQMTGWEIVVGIETHAQLATQSKMFSGASSAFGAPPNTQASAVDIALPGTLPVANAKAVEHAIRFGLAVKGQINRRSIFARKNYFYPDLPKGYQISQYELPIVAGGEVKFFVDKEERRVRLTRAIWRKTQASCCTSFSTT